MFFEDTYFIEINGSWIARPHRRMGAYEVRVRVGNGTRTKTM